MGLNNLKHGLCSVRGCTQLRGCNLPELPEACARRVCTSEAKGLLFPEPQKCNALLVELLVIELACMKYQRFRDRHWVMDALLWDYPLSYLFLRVNECQQYRILTV